MIIFEIILDIFLLMVSTYFYNQIILILLSFVKSNKTRRTWSGVIISLVDFSLLWVYALSYIVGVINGSMKLTPANLIIVIVRIAAILFVYSFFMTMIYGKIKFKTRRQKEFERLMNNQSKSYLAPIIISSIALVAGIIGWIFYHFNYTSDYKTDIWIARVITIVGALLLAYFITKAILEKKKPKESINMNFSSGFSNQFFSQDKTINVTPSSQKERNCVFIVQTTDSAKFFKGTYRGKVALNELVGQVGDYYYISSYGTLKAKGEEYDLFGVKTSYFEDSLYQEIKLTPFTSKEVEAILPYLEKNHAKVFELDENNNPINSFDA